MLRFSNVLMAGALAFSSVAMAEYDGMSPEDKGKAIFVEADNRDKGWVDMTSDMKMILKTADGQESARNLRIKSFEMKDDGDKSLTIFDEPADVRGTAMLTFSHKPPTTDEQWLFLPALKRTKRISSSNKSGPFMGSEFAYEDLSSQEVSKYTYKYLKDEKIDGIDNFVVEKHPVDQTSGYSKQVVWMEKERYVPTKIDYYDRKDSLLKTLVSKDYKQFAGKYWRAEHLNMENHQSKKATGLEWTNIKFGVGLSEGEFNQKALERLR